MFVLHSGLPGSHPDSTKWIANCLDTSLFLLLSFKKKRTKKKKEKKINLFKLSQPDGTTFQKLLPWGFTCVRVALLGPGQLHRPPRSPENWGFLGVLIPLSQLLPLPRMPLPGKTYSFATLKILTQILPFGLLFQHWGAGGRRNLSLRTAWATSEVPLFVPVA